MRKWQDWMAVRWTALIKELKLRLGSWIPLYHASMGSVVGKNYSFIWIWQKKIASCSLPLRWCSDARRIVSLCKWQNFCGCSTHSKEKLFIWRIDRSDNWWGEAYLLWRWYYHGRESSLGRVYGRRDRINCAWKLPDDLQSRISTRTWFVDLIVEKPNPKMLDNYWPFMGGKHE